MSDIKQTMTPKLHEIYCYLDRELTATWAHYKLFMDLYGGTELRVQLLNECAPVFFADMQSLLRNELFLRIARLAEDPYKGKKATIVLQSLPPLLDENAAAAIGAALRSALDDVKSHAAPIIAVRHKTIAHRDKAVALGDRADPAANLVYGDLATAMNLAGEALNIVSRHYGGPTTYYSHFIASTKGVQALIWRLKLAKHLEVQLQSNHAINDDLRRSKWWSA